MPPSGDVSPGTLVQVSAGKGRVRFSGTTAFAAGKWVGVELFEPNGKNDGSVGGVVYFRCEKAHGVFVRASQITVLDEPVQTISRSSVSRPISRTSGQSSSTPRQAEHATRPSVSASTTRLPPPSLSRTASTQSMPRAGSAHSLSKPPSSYAPPPTVTKLQRTSSTASLTSRSTSPAKPSTTAAARGSVPPTPTAAAARPPGSRLLPPTSVSRRQSLPLARTYAPSTPPVTALPSQPSQIVEESLSDIPPPDELDDDDADDALPAAPPPQAPRPAVSPVLRRVGDSPMTRHPSQAGSPSTPDFLRAPSPITPAASHRELEELRVKLRIVEAKRADDAGHIRELENRLADAEQFVALRPKLQAKLTSQQTELLELRRSAKDFLLEKEQYEARLQDVSEQMEMILLDKEVAEERAEAAQAEVEEARERAAEMEVEIEVLKEEKASYEDGAVSAVRAGEGGAGGGAKEGSLAYVQLQKQNERLREALVRLRDIAHESELDSRKKITELEKELASVEEMQSQYEMTLSKLENADAQIEDLKAQLDDALGAEDVLVQLTERNLEMSEKIEEMRIAIEDLEALKELNDELEEDHAETEKQMQEALDLKVAQLKEQVLRAEGLEETIMDYDNTIQQFREVVLTLQADNEHLREQQVTQQSETQAMNSQSQAVAALNIKLQSTVVKNQAKNIDFELRKLDAAQAREHLEIVQLFLPQVYFESDSDATACYLFFARLGYKADLINSVLAQKYNLPETLSGPYSDSLIGVCEMRGRVAHFSALCKRFVTVLRHCDPETFLRVGAVFAEIAMMEKRLDLHVELLRREEFKEMDFISDISKMLAQLEHLAETFFGGFQFDLGEQELDLVLSVDYDLDTFIACLGLVQQVLAAVTDDEEIVVESDDLDLSVTVLEPINQAINQAKGTRTAVRKVIARIQDLVKDGAALNAPLVPSLAALGALMTKAIDFAIQLAQGVSMYLSDIRASKEPLRLSRVLSTIRSIASQSIGKRDASWDAVVEILSKLSTEAAAVLPVTMEAENVFKVVGNPPWLARVQDIRSKAALNVEAERELVTLTEKNQELQRFIKAKDQSIQEAAVKIELMDRRMEIVKKQAEVINNLENQLVKARDDNQTTLDSLDKVNGDFNAAVKEIARLKAGGATGDKAAGGAELDAVVQEGTLDTSQLLEQVASLRGALRFIRSENAFLKGQSLLAELNSLPALEFLTPAQRAHPTHLPSPLPSSSYSDSDSDEESDRPVTPPPSVRTLVEATKHLYTDVLMHAATPRLVDISKSKPDDIAKWRRRRETPEYQLAARRREREALERRVTGLMEMASVAVP